MLYSSPGQGAGLTDEELAFRHLSGDPRAFADLVRRLTPSIFNLIYRWTRDRAEAENLTQETFLRAWSALPRLKLDRPIKPYFLRIALNLTRSWAEKARADGTGSENLNWQAGDGLEVADRVAADAEDLADHVSGAELQERVRAAVDQLPPLYRTVITLRYTEELSYEEIALVLEVPVNTVRTHLHRAKARLRECFQNE